jgi:hypothetical protein
MEREIAALITRFDPRGGTPCMSHHLLTEIEGPKVFTPPLSRPAHLLSLFFDAVCDVIEEGTTSRNKEDLDRAANSGRGDLRTS